MCGERGLARELGVGGNTRVRRDHVGGIRHESTVEANNCSRRQRQLAPPDDVGEVTKRANHRDTRALVRLGQVVRQNRNLDTEKGRAHGRAKQGPITIVIRMRDQRHTRRQQLRARRENLYIPAAIGLLEQNLVVSAGNFFVFELGLSNGRAERDVPQGWRLCLVCLASFDVAQESELTRGDRLVRNRAVGLGPVDREAQCTPDVFELLLVFDRQLLAQFDEVATANRQLVGGLRALVVAAFERGREVRLIGERRVAANAVVVLHATLGRQAVVIPAHRVKHFEPLHALVTSDTVGVRVAEDVTNVQRPRSRWRRGINREDGVAGLTLARELVCAGLLPLLIPERF